MGAAHGQPPTSNLVKSTDNHFVSFTQCHTCFSCMVINQGVLLSALKSMQESLGEFKAILDNSTFRIVRFEFIHIQGSEKNQPEFQLAPRTSISHIFLALGKS